MFKFLKDRKKDNKGFTLVELVIVVAILAILVGLLAPQYTKYVEQSRKAADVSNMDEMVKAVEVYSADGTANMPEKTDATIEITNSGVNIKGSGTADDPDIKKALDEFCPDYSKIKLKSKKWGTVNPTAHIAITADGAVTVTYEPQDFADYKSAAKKD